MKDLEREHHCEKHSRPCILLDSGVCYHLTNEDLAIWSKLLVSLGEFNLDIDPVLTMFLHLGRSSCNH